MSVMREIGIVSPPIEIILSFVLGVRSISALTYFWSIKEMEDPVSIMTSTK
jgi:hypothetical protein